MLRSLRLYLPAQIHGHHTVDRLEERDAERENARRSSLKSRDRSIVSQMNIRTGPRQRWGNLSETGWIASNYMGFSKRIDINFNRTELCLNYFKTTQVNIVKNMVCTCLVIDT